MSQRRTPFNIYSRDHLFTDGPRGITVPPTNCSTAFPTDDFVEEQDRLSDIEYNTRQTEYERTSKRRRIEENAREYLCGATLGIHSAALKGPITKNYWAPIWNPVKVIGTPLEAKADELKTKHLKSMSRARKLQLHRFSSNISNVSNSSQGQGQSKLTATLRASKAPQVATAKQPASPKASRTPVHGRNLNFTSSKVWPEPIVPTTSPVAPLEPLSRPAANTHKVIPPTQEAANVFRSSGPIASPAVRRVDLQIQGPLRGLRRPNHLDYSPSDTHDFSQSQPGSEPIDMDDITEDVELPDPEDSDTAEAPETTEHTEAVETEETGQDIVDRIGRLAAQLDADDSITFFQTAPSAKKRKRTDSPGTTLKASLPKVNPSVNKWKAPPSPTMEAMLRKNTRPLGMNMNRRGELGSNNKSLKEVIAMTSGGLAKKQKKQKRLSTKASVETVTIDEEPVTEVEPEIPEEVEMAPPVVDSTMNESEEPLLVVEDSVLEEPSAQRNDIQVLPSTEPQPETQQAPPVRLSQLPTPLPPSPLRLVSVAQLGKPNVPETVQEEVVEKEMPSDTSLKENQPTFIPGPRKAKRTAPRTRPVTADQPKPSSNEELKAVLTTRYVGTSNKGIARSQWLTLNDNAGKWLLRYPDSKQRWLNSRLSLLLLNLWQKHQSYQCRQNQ